MQLPWLFAVNILILLALLPFSAGIQCYYCTTETDSRCLDTRQFNSQYQTDQPTDCTQEVVDTTLARTHQHIPSPDGEKGNYDCIKIEIASRHSHGNLTTIRGCAQGQTRKYDPCVDIERHFTSPADMVRCNVCKYDYCNGASSITSWIILTVLPIIRFLAN